MASEVSTLNHYWKKTLSLRFTQFLIIALVVLTAFYSVLHIKDRDGSNYRASTVRYEFTLEKWSQQSVSEHRFLMYNPEFGVQYLSRHYINGLAFMAYQSVFQHFFVISPYWSTYLLVLFLALIYGSVLFPFLFHSRSPVLVSGLLFLGFVALVVGSKNIFHIYYYFEHDNFFGAAGVGIAALSLIINEDKIPKTKKILSISLVPVVLFGHFGSLVFLSFLVFFTSRNINKTPFMVALSIMTLSLALPYLLGDSSTYGSGSGFAGRAGLDGSVERLTTHFQAMFDPSWQGGSFPLRRWIPFFSCALLMFISCWFEWSNAARKDLIVFFKTFSTGAIAYLANWIVFPQSVSVHPYLYDMLWLLLLFFASTAFIIKRLQITDVKNLGLKEGYLCLSFMLVIMMNAVHVTQLG